MCSIKWKTIEKICIIVGPVLALIAIIHSCRTDSKLKDIQFRANAPFFVIKAIQLDIGGGVDSHYSYRDKPRELSDELYDAADWDSQIPSDYPDNYPIGLLLENVGSQLRTFSVKCKDAIVFRIVPYKKGFYELHYIYRKAMVGKPLRFTIEYETYEGIQCVHTWETTIGKKTLHRVKPPTR